MLSNFKRCLFSVIKIVFIDEKGTQWNLDTKVKVFHVSSNAPPEMYFMKCLKEKFHSVSLPLPYANGVS